MGSELNRKLDSVHLGNHKADVSPFGRGLLKDFSFREGYVNLNHGSFGAYPKVVRDAAHKYEALIDEAPDIYLRINWAAEMKTVRKTIAALVNADVSEIAMVTNASTGANTVLRSLKFENGANGILYFSTVYGSVGNTVEFLVDHSNGAIFSHVVPLTYPCSHSRILESLDTALKAVPEIKLAVFDHISSLPGVKMPWIEMIQICKKYNVLSMVDAAHGIGHAQIDLHKADPDFFTTNCHKWLHCVRSSAFLYVAKRSQSLVHPMPITHGYLTGKMRAQPKFQNQFTTDGASEFEGEFGFRGTLNLSPYLAIVDAVKYRRSLGTEAEIIEYCTDLTKRGADLVAKILGTDLMETEEAICMANVRLPLNFDEDSKRMSSAERCNWFFKTCADEFNFAFAPFIHNNLWWGRLSGQIYNQLEDFEYGGRVIKQLCERACG